MGVLVVLVKLEDWQKDGEKIVNFALERSYSWCIKFDKYTYSPYWGIVTETKFGEEDELVYWHKLKT